MHTHIHVHMNTHIHVHIQVGEGTTCLNSLDGVAVPERSLALRKQAVQQSAINWQPKHQKKFFSRARMSKGKVSAAPQYLVRALWFTVSAAIPHSSFPGPLFQGD